MVSLKSEELEMEISKKTPHRGYCETNLDLINRNCLLSFCRQQNTPVGMNHSNFLWKTKQQRDSGT